MITIMMIIDTINDDETDEQDGAELGQAQVKLEVIVEVGVGAEDR